MSKIIDVFMIATTDLDGNLYEGSEVVGNETYSDYDLAITNHGLLDENMQKKTAVFKGSLNIIQKEFDCEMDEKNGGCKCCNYTGVVRSGMIEQPCHCLEKLR